MVLWEITLGTAYFLGLKRTYRLALKLQRRLISPNRPRIRQFLYRRTRTIFDVALRVHQNIQQRDLEVGRNLGNWILRWLDRMKPSAHIRSDLTRKPPTSGNTTKHLTNSSDHQPPGTTQRSNCKSGDRESDGRIFASSMNVRPKYFPTMAVMMRPPNPAGTNIQYRHLCISGPDMPRLNNGRGGFQGVIRNDIREWMLRN